MNNPVLLPLMGLVFIALVAAAVAVAAGFKKLNADKRIQQEQTDDGEQTNTDDGQPGHGDDVKE